MTARTNALIEKAFFLAAVASMFVTVMMFAFMVILGLPIFAGGHFFSLLVQPWNPGQGFFGIFPMITGTMIISLLSLCWAFPLSFGASALVTVIHPRGLGAILRKFIVMMTAIPTVVYGFVGVFLLVPFIQTVFAAGSGMSILTASLMLALLISPTMILIFSDAFDSVPRAYRDAGDALGGSPVQKFWYIVVPYSWRGIVAGLVLALGRAMGDTLIAVMLSGNAVARPSSIFDSARTLTAHIALVTAADFDSVEFRTIFASGIILYLGTTVLIVVTRSLTRKREI